MWRKASVTEEKQRTVPVGSTPCSSHTTWTCGYVRTRVSFWVGRGAIGGIVYGVQATLAIARNDKRRDKGYQKDFNSPPRTWLRFGYHIDRPVHKERVEGLDRWSTHPTHPKKHGVLTFTPHPIPYLDMDNFSHCVLSLNLAIALGVVWSIDRAVWNQVFGPTRLVITYTGC